MFRMNRARHIPVALTIAGSDSGGSAGIQADLKTFAALGVHGCTVITAITAQNSKAITKVVPSGAAMVRAQLAAIDAALPPAAAKSGMLHGAAIVREVIAWRQAHRSVPFVVDPVMVATSGRLLLSAGAAKLLQTELLPLAALVTPNLPEANLICRRGIRSERQMREAAREIHERHGCAVLIKGGHLPDAREAVDVLFDGKREFIFRAPWIRGPRPHGTGCTLSAAITAFLARGYSLSRAVGAGKRHLTSVLKRTGWAGKEWVASLAPR